MCIIVDANVATEFEANSADAVPVLAMLLVGKLSLVVDSETKEELFRTNLRRMFRQLSLAGRVREFEASLVKVERDKIDKLNIRSNDAHILALARISGARILFSRDKKLHADFKDVDILPTPRGKIYQKASQRRLLREGICNCL